MPFNITMYAPLRQRETKRILYPLSWQTQNVNEEVDRNLLLKATLRMLGIEACVEDDLNMVHLP